MKFKKLLGRLIIAEIKRQLDEESGTLTPPEQAKKIGLVYGGWGRWLDKEGDVVARTVHGHLVKVLPQDIENIKRDDVADPEINSRTNAEMEQIWKDAAKWEYKPQGYSHVNPGWNKGGLKSDDIPFDANAEQTVQKLLAKVGNPAKLVNWLVKKFHEETPNGKKRILQYLGVLKQMGISDNANADEQPNATQEAPPQEAPKKVIRPRDLFNM